MLNRSLLALSLLLASSAHAEILQYSPAPASGGGFTPGTDVSSGTATASGATSSRTLSALFANTYYAANYGVSCDGVSRTDASVTNGSNQISSLSYKFTQADVNATIVVSNSAENTALNTTIASVNAGTGVATMAANWGGGTSTTSNARFTFYHADNTAAINAALAAASTPDANGHNMKGFRLVFPDGVCATGQITQPRLSLLTCEGGKQACTLFAKSGTNADLVTSENFATLTGTGLNYGNGVAANTSPNVPSFFGFGDLHIDGNKAGNASGRCIAYYGNAEFLTGEWLIEGCAGDNIYTEASGDYASSPTDWMAQEECFIGHGMSRGSGGYNWRDRGCHDKAEDNIIMYGGASGNYINEVSSTVDGTGAPIYNGGSHFTQFHPYTASSGVNADFGAPTTGLYYYNDFGQSIIRNKFRSALISSSSCGYSGLDCFDVTSTAAFDDLSNLQLEFSASATGVNGVSFASGAGPAHARVQGSSVVPGANVVGANIANNFSEIGGEIANLTGSGSSCAKVSGSYDSLDLRSFSCATHLNYSGSGHNKIEVQAYTNAGANGAALSGTPNAQDYFLLLTDDPAHPSFLSVPTFLGANGGGTASAPDFSFLGDTTTGFYHSGAGKIDISAGGTQVGEWTSAGLTLKNGATVTGMNQGVTYASGNWYNNQPQNSALGVFPTAGILVAQPIQVFGSATFDKIGMEVSAIGSGASAFMCLYDATGANGGPGALVTGGSTTSAAVASTGDFAQPFASPVALSAGIYWAAAEFSWTTTAPTMYLASSAWPGLKWIPQGTLFDLTSGQNGNTAYSLTNTYASGCPSTYGTPTGKVQSTSTPIMALHAQ